MYGSKATEETRSRFRDRGIGEESGKEGGRRQSENPTELQDNANSEVNFAGEDAGEIAGGEAELPLAGPLGDSGEPESGAQSCGNAPDGIVR
jgi:hypothetical protein